VCPLDGLRENVADDRRDSATAIYHGRSRGAVIDDKAIVALIKFQECHAGEFPVISEPNEPTAHQLQAAGWIGEGDDLLFRYKRLLSDRDAPRVGNGALKFDDGQPFRLCSRQTLDARRDELAAISEGANKSWCSPAGERPARVRP
jgi:hypothetical protein